MNINKLLQLAFYLLFLTSVVALLLAVITAWHLPAMTLWGILAITTATVGAAVTHENTTNNQKEDQK